MLAASATSLLAHEVVFSKDVAPILYQNCTGCHRPGEAAPFSLISYEDAAKRGRLIRSVVERRRMPPWKADASTHAFQDERRLTDEQIGVIRTWVEGGVPEGDPADTPALPQFPAGWQLGQPDLVVEMPEGFTVPADGPDIYRNFVIQIALPEDKWVRAIELRPSARPVFHHVLYMTDATGASRRADAADPLPGWSGDMGAFFVSGGGSLGGWAAGAQPHLLRDGLAMPFRKGSDLVLQCHFHPVGVEMTEKAVIGLYFADRAPEREMVGIQLPPVFGRFSGLNIPPDEADYRKSDEFVLPVDIEAVSINAHAHYIGKTMKMTAIRPDGVVETLLSISDWDFAWQDQYYFKEFVPLPRGTKIRAEVSWDNSSANPRNPSNPPVRVKWGEESKDEMGSITLRVVASNEAERAQLEAAVRTHLIRAAMGGGR
jgi:hypothetical protein